MPKKILLIGNTSMLGGRIYALLNGKYEIKTAGRRGNYDYYMDLAEDVTKPLGADINEHFDAIINCAAVIKGEPVMYELVNAVGSIRIAEMCKRIQCPHLIDINSIAAIEDPRNNFFNSYGMSKKHGTQFIQFLAKEGSFKFTTLLISNLYDSAGRSEIYQRLFYSIIKSVKEGKEIVFWGNNDAQRNFIYVDDVVRVIEKVIDLGVYGVWNCAFPGGTCKFSEIARIAGEVLGREAAYSFDKTKENIMNVYIPEDDSLFKEIGWYPEIDLREGIRRIKERWLES